MPRVMQGSGQFKTRTPWYIIRLKSKPFSENEHYVGIGAWALGFSVQFVEYLLGTKVLLELQVKLHDHARMPTTTPNPEL